MSRFDEQYIDLCRRILQEGEKIQNYKGTDQRGQAAAAAIPDHTSQRSSGAKTIRLPHQVMQFDLSEEFPILVSKKVGYKSAILEMLWIFQVASNRVKWLRDRKVHIWDEWEISETGEYQGRNLNRIFKEKHPNEKPEDFAGTIGTAYGWIVKRYNLIDNLIETLRNNPGNRRMIVSLWQNEWLETAALPSCVWNSQWNVTDGRLNILVTSRSTDVPLGLPYNIVQYAVMCHMLAQVTGYQPGIFTFITNDAHIYENQIEGIKEQIAQYDKAVKVGKLPKAPKLWLNPEVREFKDFDNSKELKDIRLEGYEHLGVIKMPVTE